MHIIRKTTVSLLFLVILSLPVVAFASPAVSVTGQAHVENIGWMQEQAIPTDIVLGTSGEHKKMEGLTFRSSDPEQYSLRCRAHVENIGWQEPVGNGELVGTTGRNCGIETLVITQEGTQAPNCELSYRVHVENYGWTNWANSGEPVGTTGQNCQIEAVQLRIYGPSDQTRQSFDASDVSWPYLSAKNVSYKDVFALSNIYPHQTESWTEGLFFYNNRLYETGGRLGKSAIYKNIDLATAAPELRVGIDPNMYAEGSSVLNGRLYVLTYEQKRILMYDPESLAYIGALPYNRQGWGLTQDGNALIASDGSSHIYFMDDSGNDIRSITVHRDGVEISNLNELEYVDGKILANVWKMNEVLVIDRDTGEVTKTIHFDGMYSGPGEVQNGIAYNPDTGRIYFTGKLWIQTLEFGLQPYALQ